MYSCETNLHCINPLGKCGSYCIHPMAGRGIKQLPVGAVEEVNPDERSNENLQENHHD